MRTIKGIFVGEPMIYETCNLKEEMGSGENFGFVSTKPEKLRRNIERIGPISGYVCDGGETQCLFEVARFVFGAAIHPDESIP